VVGLDFCISFGLSNKELSSRYPIQGMVGKMGRVNFRLHILGSAYGCSCFVSFFFPLTSFFFFFFLKKEQEQEEEGDGGVF
jgi:hypothetical protein